jgi:hypothetical protein
VTAACAGRRAGDQEHLVTDPQRGDDPRPVRHALVRGALFIGRIKTFTVEEKVIV